MQHKQLTAKPDDQEALDRIYDALSQRGVRHLISAVGSALRRNDVSLVILEDVTVRLRALFGSQHGEIVIR